MNQPPFHRLPKAEVQRLLNEWCRTIDSQAHRFVDRWLAGRVPVEKTLTGDRIREAMMFVRGSIRLAHDIPDEERLPLWLAPGRAANSGFPAEPDLESAWRLDEFAAWNVKAMLRLWPKARVAVHESQFLKSKLGDHHAWMINAGDPRHWVDVAFAPRAVCESLYPESDPGLSIRHIDHAVRLQVEQARTPAKRWPWRR